MRSAHIEMPYHNDNDKDSLYELDLDWADYINRYNFAS